VDGPDLPFEREFLRRICARQNRLSLRARNAISQDIHIISENIVRAG
jgi:hypothetical protein